MMNDGVVTVYNSENCGSFLQAYAMARIIKKNGCEALMVRQNFGDHSSSYLNYLKAMVRATLGGNFSGARRLRERRSLFLRAVSDKLQIVEKHEKVDCYVLGSDTIWDVSIPFFRNHAEFFWGTQFEDTKIISYAPSVGHAKADNVEKCGFIREALSRMSAVSVRDEISRALLQPYCDKEIQIVCDPTYLLDRADYDAIAKPTELKDFLFIYYYGKMPVDDRQAIQTFAKQKGLKTVVFGGANPWCDISLAYDPLLFLSIYDKADYIITNTFHGTVFATIYEKRFAVLKNEKQKILDVLRMCNMSDKMTNGSEDISAILNGEFDYATTRQRISAEREKSLRYLKTAIEG